MSCFWLQVSAAWRPLISLPGNFNDTNWTIIYNIDPDILFPNILPDVIKAILDRIRHGTQHNDNC